jgi:3-phosphoshikimate 1-carboxyvinyltransferase
MSSSAKGSVAADTESTVLLIGLGMIGGSIARGLRKAVPQRQLLALDNDPVAVEQALADGTLTRAELISDSSAVSPQGQTLLGEADIVLLCVPPLQIGKYLEPLARYCGDSCVFSDVGSVKSHLRAPLAQQTALFRRRFVPGHPIAGSEKSGFSAAASDLFNGRRVILTPLPENSATAVNAVHGLWRELGAEVIGMDIVQHDAVLAATSHLPHALAFAIVDLLQQSEESEDIFRYAAGGFADFSRLASSNPRMWADVFVANSDATVDVLGSFIDNLKGLQLLIEQQNTAVLEAQFQRANRTRERFLTKHFDKSSQSEEVVSELSFELDCGGALAGSVRVPGDKSISHRSVILGSIAAGTTEVSGFLEGEDALNTVAAFREMGVTIVGPELGRLKIFGVGKYGLKAPRRPLYMGNSGTAMRLLAGLLSAQPFDSVLTGDESLSKRPMKRVSDPLGQMGARISTRQNGTPPLEIAGASLHGIRYAMPMASAQVKSALLLAGIYAKGETEVVEPAVCRDHTERMLQGFGVSLRRNGSSVQLSGDSELQGQTIDVPGDISSAAFFLVGASIAEGSDLTLEHVGVNPTRTGIVELLSMMGADISLDNPREVGGEPVADIRVRSARLKGIDIPAEQIPLAIDEFPVLFIAAACAEGDTVLRGAEELRVKESDRIAAMAAGLQTLGVSHEVFPDGIRISGGEFGGGEIDSLGDHRIAMAFSIASLRASAPIAIRHCNNVATSFPGFVELASSLGLKIRIQADS